MRSWTIGLPVAVLMALCACDGSSDDDASGLRIAFSVTPPLGGITDVAWLDEGATAGGLLVVEIQARDISSDFDGFDIEVTFDPLVASAQSVTSAGLLEGCSADPVLKLENVSNGNANLTGTILISEAFAGVTPPACSVVGERTVARINFQAAGRGGSALDFVLFNGDPNSPAGSRFYRRSPQVPEIPMQFFDGDALIEVTRR